jgi:CCR4-NOT transcription complex subunit 6
VVVEEARRFAEGAPLLLGGDWNHQPHTPPYELLARGELSASAVAEIQGLPLFELARRVFPDAANDACELARRCGLRHDAPTLRSAFHQVRGREPRFTDFTYDFKGALDFLWFSSDEVGAHAALEHVDERLLWSLQGAPNQHFPSDHLSCKFVMSVPRARRHAAEVD